jgi:hypothetical protein
VIGLCLHRREEGKGGEGERGGEGTAKRQQMWKRRIGQGDGNGGGAADRAKA